MSNLPAHFWKSVNKTEACWLWTGSITWDGYGRFGKYDTAHRAAYRALVGPIPSDLQVDHLCCTRNCVNPAHLELVTFAENIQRAVERRTACRKGHPRTPENWVADYEGGYRCRPCHDAAKARYRARRRVSREEAA